MARLCKIGFCGRKWNVSAHSESCRAVRFTGDGRLLLTGSPDCSIVATDVETGQAVARLTGAHGAAINRIINATDWSIASGDDEGTIKVHMQLIIPEIVIATYNGRIINPLYVSLVSHSYTLVDVPLFPVVKSFLLCHLLFLFRLT
jgi:WD40 repeat protein